MANELSLQVAIAYTKGTGNARNSLNAQLSLLTAVTGRLRLINSQKVGTSNEIIYKGDIGTLGYVAFQNKDTTNYVTLSADAAAHANPLPKLRANGGLALFEAASDVYGKANTAECEVDVYLIEL